MVENIFSFSHFGQNTGIFPIKRPFCHRQEAIGIWNQWIVSQNDYAHLVLIPTITVLLHCELRTHIFPTNCNKHNELQNPCDKIQKFFPPNKQNPIVNQDFQVLITKRFWIFIWNTLWDTLKLLSKIFLTDFGTVW